MALIFAGESRCPICGEVINQDDEIVATSHFIGDDTDPLWRFSDAAIHRHCFLAWECREEFIERFNAEVGSITFANGTFHEMRSDGSVVSKQRGGRRA
jgi:hypothetical protein